MLGTTLDIEAPGVDPVAGHGIFDALEAGLAVQALAPDLPALRTPLHGALALLLAVLGLLIRRRPPPGGGPGPGSRAPPGEPGMK
jgi:hypothetical protein